MTTTSIKQQRSITQARTGFFLIVAGGFAFAANVFGFSLENWWALFILLPAIFFNLMARQVAREENGRSQSASHILNGISLVIFVVAAMFLLNLDWGQWWPLMLLAPGTAFLRLGWQQVDSKDNPTGFSFAATSRWIGITLLLLGGVFLLNQRFGLVLNGRFENIAWWGIFPLIFAIGLFFNAWKAYSENDYQINGAATFLGFASILVAVSGILELFHMSWDSLNNIVGIALVFGGLSLILINNKSRQASTKML